MALSTETAASQSVACVKPPPNAGPFRAEATGLFKQRKLPKISTVPEAIDQERNYGCAGSSNSSNLAAAQNEAPRPDITKELADHVLSNTRTA